MINPTTSFKANLQLMPAIGERTRIEIFDQAGSLVASIENEPGKQGALVVYHYLQQCFETLDVKAAAHGLAVFAEHTVDAKNRPGAHPNIDRLLEIIDGGVPLNIQVLES